MIPGPYSICKGDFAPDEDAMVYRTLKFGYDSARQAFAARAEVSAESGIAGAFFRAGEHLAQARRGSLPKAARRARRAKRARQIEAWGRGIQRIFGACKEAGTPVPKIEWDGGDLWFEFPYSRKYLDEVSAAVGQEGGLGEKLGEKLGENRLRILRLMKADPTVSSKKISNSVGISLTAVDKNISLLKDRGFIRRIGPAKGGHWEVIRQNQH
jgi:predicted HTH transcriptional regulator